MEISVRNMENSLNLQINIHVATMWQQYVATTLLQSQCYIEYLSNNAVTVLMQINSSKFTVGSHTTGEKKFVKCENYYICKVNLIIKNIIIYLK